VITYQAKALKDPEVQKVISNVDVITKPNADELIDQFKEWSGFEMDGYEAYITDGVTGAYTNFEFEYSNYRTVTLQGEYPYHRTNGAKRINSLSELDLNQDKLIVSDPFAATGNSRDDIDMVELISEKIPVFIDHAYFGLIDYNQYTIPRTQYFALSFSKMFGLGGMRFGICFRRTDKPVPMKTLNEYSYINYPACNAAKLLMDNFKLTDMRERYIERQKELCKKLEVIPSDSFLFGITSDNKYDGFSREGLVNRLGLSDMLTNPNQEIKLITKP